MSTEERKEERPRKAVLPLATVDLLLATVNSIRAKGGIAPFDTIQTTTGKSEGIVKSALSTGCELGLISTEGDQYKLTDFGSRFAAASETEMKQLLCEVLLKYEPYNTVLLRIKNAPEHTLGKNDITKAWYDLYKTGTDLTRKKYTAAFSNIGDWCGLVENRKKTVVLTTEGSRFLEGVVSGMAMPPIAPTAPLVRETPQIQPRVVETPVLPITTTISIDIAVDIKEENSVQNLIRIIKALRGEKELPEKPKE